MERWLEVSAQDSLFGTLASSNLTSSSPYLRDPVFDLKVMDPEDPPPLGTVEPRISWQDLKAAAFHIGQRGQRSNSHCVVN